jgi:hypothetical protein
MQGKEWMREFGRCNLWSTWAQKSQSEDDRARENRAREEPEATQAGRPPLYKHPPPGALLWQASNSPNSLFVCSNF